MKTKSICAGAIAALTFAVLGAFSPAQAAPHWAPADSATIHPGVMTFTDGAQCTANFVFTEGTDVFIGQAAHCSGTGAATDTNGCDAGSLPLGTQVEIDGASQPGTLAYSSWLTMQQENEQSADACNFNDFALVKLHPADHDKVNPTVPDWGGPVGIAGPTNFGDAVYSYGNSSLRLGIAQLSPKTGISLGTIPSGWSHPVYTATPGIPGDSGSAFLDKDGNALGVLSTLAIAPIPASNNVSDIGLALQYMHANSSVDAQLVPGTEAFNSEPLGLGGVLSGLGL